MNTHITDDQRLHEDITWAHDALSGYIDTGLDIEIPAWLLPTLYTSNAQAIEAERNERVARALRNTLAVIETIKQEAARNHQGTVTMIQPVVPNVPVREITTYLSREDTVIGYLREGGRTPLPITNHRCIACGELVDLCKPQEFAVSRVAGDSEYGYEAYHNACNQ